MFREGDWVLIVHGERKFLRRIDPKDSINVRKDVLRFRDVIGKEGGDRVGNFYLFKPTLEDIILYGFKRETQIVYPKDSFYIALKIGAVRGKRVLEFGTGSGAMCAVLASAGSEVHTFEIRERFFKLAKKNLERFGLEGEVHFYREDFATAEVKVEEFDCAFVDVRDPLPYLEKVYACLKKGSPVCFLLPTTNQVASLLASARGLFGDFEVKEILVRDYNPNPDRLRPKDRMVGHTAFTVFGRKISNS